LNYLNNNIKY